jgi:hypothetical protein
MHCKFLLLFSCFIAFLSFGQKFASSPFSSNGIGEMGTLDHASFSGIGNVNVSVIDSLNLNYFNPSSYSFLAIGQPLFSTGISYRRSNFSENSNEFTSNLTGINHFAFAVPFAKRFGFAFGLKPFSRTGYSITEKVYLGSGTDTMNYSYVGNGGFNDAFTGFSVKLLNYKNNQIGLGANVSYIFGNFSNERYSNLVTQESGGIELSKYQMKSLHYDLGFNYQFSLKNRINLTLAATYTPNQQLRAFKDVNLYYATNIANVNTVKDTIYSISEEGKFNMPSNLNLGFAFSYRPKVDSLYNKVKVYQLSLYGSYSSSTWSHYKTSFESDLPSSFLNVIKYNFGLEFIPHFNYLDRNKTISYFSRVRYRAGFQYATLPIQRLNKQLNDQSLSFGLSFPIVSQRSVSSLNFGFTAGKRGNNESLSLNEKYLGVNFGITIAPGSADRWFRKYKID